MEFDLYYEKAKRFDEVPENYGAQYTACSKQRQLLEELAEHLYGRGAVLLLEEYADLFSELTELECRHFFREGVLMAGGPVSPT